MSEHTYPHRIRLREPWEREPIEGGGGRLRCRRKFGAPGRIDAHERLWLTLSGFAGTVDVWLNNQHLDRAHGPVEFEVTTLLSRRNELILEFDSPPATEPPWGEVALEIRCAAFLRGVKWRRDEHGKLQVTGEVVGAGTSPLDLYALVENKTVAYGTALPTPEGTAFYLTSTEVIEREHITPIRIDLVNGGVVWFTHTSP
jgi:hypothetical protein